MERRPDPVVFHGEGAIEIVNQAIAGGSIYALGERSESVKILNELERRIRLVFNPPQ